MKHLYCLVMTLLLPVSLEASYLFYQPQNTDATLEASEWAEIWSETREAGFESVIVQWTAHGSSDFDGSNGWLRNALFHASQHGLSLVLGLDYDEDYYSVMSSAQDKVFYWHHLLSRARLQQEFLRDWKLPVSGWYLPYELDDVLYRDQVLMDELKIQLASFSRLDNLPLHISAFSSGNLAPRVYAQWLNTLNQNGFRIWWQDGAGTGRKPADAIAVYQQHLPCTIGIVREQFVAIATVDGSFRAAPVSVMEESLPLPHDSRQCHPEAVFSLRYLPFAEAMRKE